MPITDRSTEPLPAELAGAVPRYYASGVFPPYRYVPGQTPHPTRDREGHSYGSLRRDPHPAGQPGDWRGLSAWLWGVDLFNASYFWEAHEAWEGLWGVQPRQSPAALFLQGMIQLAAAMLKVRAGSVEGAASLSRSALEKIGAVAAEQPHFLGADLVRLIAEYRHYFRPLAERTLPPPDASVPLLVLSVEVTG